MPVYMYQYIIYHYIYTNMLFFAEHWTDDLQSTVESEAKPGENI